MDSQTLDFFSAVLADLGNYHEIRLAKECHAKAHELSAMLSKMAHGSTEYEIDENRDGTAYVTSTHRFFARAAHCMRKTPSTRRSPSRADAEAYIAAHRKGMPS